MRLPHPHLIVLRSVITLELSLLIGQAGWAAAGLGGERHYFSTHAWFALPTLLMGLVNAMCYVILRRTAGIVCLVLAVLLAVMSGIQYALGDAHVVGLHIFFGILTIMTATTLTSWTYRLPAPETQSSKSI